MTGFSIAGLEKYLRDFLREPRFRNREPKAQAWIGKQENIFRCCTLMNYKDKVKKVIGRDIPYFKLKGERK